MQQRFASVVVLPGVLALLAGTTLCSVARADDDDQKLRDRKPAVLGPIFRGPDPWKLASHDPTGGSGGPADAGFPSRNVTLQTWIPLNNFPGYTGGGANGADCWGYTSPSGRRYALIGLSWGTGVVEVTNPTSPVILTVVPGPNSLWHDVTVIGQYAYAVTDNVGVGIQVIDLHQIDTGTVTLVRNYSQGGHTTTHTILSNPDSGYLYLCGGNAAGGGMIAAATTPDPTFPTFTGPGWHPQYVHEAQIVNYTSGPYAGHEIAFCFAAGPYYGASYTRAMSIVDITSKASPITLSLIAYPGMNFCHQGWTTADRKYLYMDDELDSPGAGNGNVPRFLCRVFDISNLSDPRVVSVFSNGLPSVDHNQYVNGRYLYQSNYTTGLRVWDLQNPLRPREVGYLDTRPEDDGTGYNGAWGNYPFFSDGTILISDLERGLFIVKLSMLEFETPSGAPTTIQPGQHTPVSVQVNERGTQVTGVQLFAIVNGGVAQSYPMTAQGGGLYSADLPAVLCYDRVSYYFQASASNSNSYVWPAAALSGEPYRALAQTSETTVFSDNFETNQGWTVQNDPSLTSGGWVRAVPIASGGHGAVIGDGDGSGQCYMTGNTLSANVDGGPTRLLSPVLNLSGSPEARVTYKRWFVSLVGTADSLLTEVSGDNGATWTAVHSVSPASGGWEQVGFRVADYITPTAQVRVRFTTSDAGNDSVTEAGIDAFTVTSPQCTFCYPNCDASTAPPALNVADFTCFLQSFAAGEPYANCDNSITPPVLNVADFTCFLQRFANGCP